MAIWQKSDNGVWAPWIRPGIRVSSVWYGMNMFIKRGDLWHEVSQRPVLLGQYGSNDLEALQSRYYDGVMFRYSLDYYAGDNLYSICTFPGGYIEAGCNNSTALTAFSSKYSTQTYNPLFNISFGGDNPGNNASVTCTAGSDGHFYVAYSPSKLGQFSTKVFKFDIDGNQVMESSDTGYPAVWSICYDPAGYIIVVNTRSQIHKLNANDGSIIWHVDAEGGDSFNYRDTRIDEDGNIYLYYDTNIQAYDPLGNEKWSLGAYGIGTHPNKWLVVAREDNPTYEIVAWDQSKNFVGTLVSGGTGGVINARPRGIEFDPEGNMFVFTEDRDFNYDPYTPRVHKFRPSNTGATSYTEDWSEQVQLAGELRVDPGRYPDMWT